VYPGNIPEVVLVKYDNIVTIIDLQKERIIYTLSNYGENHYLHSPIESNWVGIVSDTLEDVKKEVYFNKIVFHLGHEGEFIYIWKRGGKILMTSEECIDIMIKRPNIYEMYIKLGGPVITDMPEGDCYMMLLVHDKFKRVTTVTENFVEYVSYMSQSGKYPPKLEGVRIPKIVSINQVNGYLFPRSHGVYKNQNRFNQITVEKDKIYFDHNASRDPRLQGGEFVVGTYYGGEYPVFFTMESPGYAFRSQIIEKRGDLWNNYLNKIKEINQVNHEHIVKKLPKLFDQDGAIKIYTPIDRRYYMYSLFWDCVTPCYKEIVTTFDEKYKQYFNKIYSSILNTKLSSRDKNKSEVIKTIVNLKQNKNGMRQEMYNLDGKMLNDMYVFFDRK